MQNIDQKLKTKNVLGYFEKKLYILSNADIYIKERELTYQIDRIKSGYPRNLIDRTKQFDEDTISAIKDRITNLETQYNNYKEEAAILINKKCSIRDFFNGTFKKDKDRIKQLGINMEFSNLEDGGYSININGDFNKGSLMDNISDEITLLKVELHELDLARIKDQEITKIKAQIENLNLEYKWKGDFELSSSKEFLNHMKNKVINEKENFEAWITRKDQNNNYIIATHSDLHNFLLLNDWKWHDWSDGSGSLESPDNKPYFQYDLSTNEYKYLDSEDWDLFSIYEHINLETYKEYAEQVIGNKIFDISLKASMNIDSRIEITNLEENKNPILDIEKEEVYEDEFEMSI